MGPHDEHAIQHESPRDPAEFARLALWMAANFAGMVTAVLLARGPFYRSLAARVGRGKKQMKPPSPQRSLSMLAGTIIGSSKTTIESVFGPPRSTGLDNLGVLVHPQVIFWQSDLWYYPVPRDGQTAMAINFRDQHATHVEFFTPPQPPKV